MKFLMPITIMSAALLSTPASAQFDLDKGPAYTPPTADTVRLLTRLKSYPQSGSERKSVYQIARDCLIVSSVKLVPAYYDVSKGLDPVAQSSVNFWRPLHTEAAHRASDTQRDGLGRGDTEVARQVTGGDKGVGQNELRRFMDKEFSKCEIIRGRIRR